MTSVKKVKMATIAMVRDSREVDGGLVGRNGCWDVKDGRSGGSGSTGGKDGTGRWG